MGEPQWEVVSGRAGECLRRIMVPGGWLYQVELDWRVTDETDTQVYSHVGWGIPVFVPELGARL